MVLIDTIIIVGLRYKLASYRCL